MPSTIACPTCHSEIAIDEVLTAQLTAQLRGEMEREIRLKDDELDRARNKVAEKRLEVQMAQEQHSTLVQTEVDKQCKAILAEAKQAAEQKLMIELHDEKSHVEELSEKLSEPTAQSVDAF